MPLITKQSIDEVFDAVNVETFRTILNRELKKEGSGFTCLSPFADEKTPSFKVFARGTRYKDFSSGNGGNAIGLVMKLENLSFPEAVERVASITGTQLRYEDKVVDVEKMSRIEEMQTTLELSMKAFEKKLHSLPHEHPVWADQLIGRRQLDMDTIHEWGLGYAPDDWTWLWDQLREQGKYTPALALGLVNTKGDKTFDSLRNAVIFPIHNERGELVSHAGRLLNTEPYKGKKPPKYINGPSNDIYNKSRILYGMHIARKAISIRKEVFLVEGYFDVINMHRAGAENTVATCGTALTPEHCALLQRIGTRRVNITRDQDPAGRKAAMRDFELILGYGMEPRVVVLPEDQDPDDYACTMVAPCEKYVGEKMKV